MKKHRSPFIYLLITGLLLALAVFSVEPAFAAVELIYFRADASNSRILLEWQTGSELDNAGFQVLRNTTGGSDPDDYTIISVEDSQGDPTTIIFAKGDSTVGATYTYYDPNVVNGTRYYYLLRAVDTDNIYEHHGPVSAVGGQTATPSPTATLTRTATRTLTPAASNTSSSSNRTNTPTRTRVPTRTPRPQFNSNNSSNQATNTSTPDISPTPDPNATPSNTPSPTITPTPLTPLDQTATAIVAQVTPLISMTPSVEYYISYAERTETPTPTPTNTRTPDPRNSAIRPVDENLQKNLVSVIAGVLLSGGLLTGGFIFFFARRREDEEEPDGA
jgi:hypothetical protein